MPRVQKVTKLLSFIDQKEGNDYYFKLIKDHAYASIL